jgi:hypothetical protein
VLHEFEHQEIKQLFMRQSFTFSASNLISVFLAFICFKYLSPFLVASPIAKEESQKLISIFEPCKWFLLLVACWLPFLGVG